MSKNPEVNPLPRLTLPQMLREQAKQHAGRIAIRQKDFGIWQGITWDDYYRRSSHVGLGLRALGLSDEIAHSSIRFSVGRFTTEGEIDRAVAQVKGTVERLRSLSPLWDMHQAGIDLASIQWAAH